MEYLNYWFQEIHGTLPLHRRLEFQVRLLYFLHYQLNDYTFEELLDLIKFLESLKELEGIVLLISS